MNIEIHGKRWFQKTYGNTYHTAEIFIDGKYIITTPIKYGNGDQYLQTGYRWLQFMGYVGANIRLFTDSPISSAIRATSSVIDVPRKRDL